jgi:hypothetical protein
MTYNFAHIIGDVLGQVHKGLDPLFEKAVPVSNEWGLTTVVTTSETKMLLYRR